MLVERNDDGGRATPRQGRASISRSIGSDRSVRCAPRRRSRIGARWSTGGLRTAPITYARSHNGRTRRHFDLNEITASLRAAPRGRSGDLVATVTITTMLVFDTPCARITKSARIKSGEEKRSRLQYSQKFARTVA